MLRYLIVGTLLFGFGLSALRAQEGWSGGLTVQPFHYWLYNETDYNEIKKATAVPGITGFALYVDDQSIVKPTGFGVGGTLRYGFSERWSLRSELTWSTQQQRYYYPYLLEAEEGSSYSIQSRLDYLRLPVMLEANFGYSGNSWLHFGLGLQSSFLTRYQDATFRESNTGPDESSRYSFWLTDKGSSIHSVEKNYEQTEIRRNTVLRGHTDWMYQRWQWGAVVRLGVSRWLGDRWVLDVSVRGEFDFSNADNLDAKYRSGSLAGSTRWVTGLRANATGLVPGGGEGRTPTHNIRGGLDLSLRFLLGR